LRDSLIELLTTPGLNIKQSQIPVFIIGTLHINIIAYTEPVLFSLVRDMVDISNLKSIIGCRLEVDMVIDSGRQTAVKGHIFRYFSIIITLNYVRLFFPPVTVLKGVFIS
jgi:hypothetical protein